MGIRVVHVAMVLMVLCSLNTQVSTIQLTEVCDTTVKQEECANDVTNSRCIGVPVSRCQCDAGFHQTSLTTCERVKLTEICDTALKQAECANILNSQCAGVPTPTCQCDAEFYQASEITCEQVNAGDSCTNNPSNMPCSSVPDGVCVDGKCACGSGLYAVDITPYFCSRVRIGDRCQAPETETDCLKIPNAECTDDTKECQCTHGFGGVVGSTLCTPEATVRCSKSDSVMTMEIRAVKDANHQQIVTARGAGDLTTSECKMSTFSTNKDFLELTITVDISTLEQTDPVKTTSDCFVEIDAIVDTQINVLVVGQTDTDYVQGADKFYKVMCDSVTANGEEVVLQDVGITSAIDPTEKTSAVDDVTLELVKADDNTALTPPISLIEEVKLKITLTRKAHVTAPLGLFLHDLHVSDLADLSDSNVKKLKMLNQDGCVQDIAAFKLESTFAPVDNTILAASATKFEALTGKFNLALFEGMDDLKLFFSVEYEASCFVNTEDKCFDLQQYCTDNTPQTPASISRRRRSPTQVRNGTATLGVSVYLGGPRAANQDGVVSDLQTKDECKTSQYFWIIAVVLGCLALAALLFAFFLFHRLRREQRRSDKLDEKLRVRNPAF